MFYNSEVKSIFISFFFRNESVGQKIPRTFVLTQPCWGHGKREAGFGAGGAEWPFQGAVEIGVGAEPSLWRVDTWLSQMHSGLLGVEVDASGQGG